MMSGLGGDGGMIKEPKIKVNRSKDTHKKDYYASFY